MQALTEKVFKLAPPGGVFNSTVVANLFPSASPGARALLVHRATTAGEVLILKPGLYMLSPIHRRSELHPFAVAGMLYGPSHISLESALAYHGLIPEAVYQVSSVTLNRSRQFVTPIGVFDFKRVPLKEPRAGVEATEVTKGVWSFVATPLRAIADILYLRRNITWATDGLNFLTDSLRIEPEDLAAIANKSFEKLISAFSNQRVRSYLQGLYRSVKP